MEKIKNLSIELLEKQTKARKTLDNFLIHWSTATKDHLEDSSLLNLGLLYDNNSSHDVYFLTRQFPDILFIRGDLFNVLHPTEVVEKASVLNINECDFALLKKIIRSILGGLNQYQERLEKAKQEYEENIKLLSTLYIQQKENLK